MPPCVYASLLFLSYRMLHVLCALLTVLGGERGLPRALLTRFTVGGQS